MKLKNRKIKHGKKKKKMIVIKTIKMIHKNMQT